MRRTDLDALRIVLCGSIILAHALLIFAFEPYYHLKAAEPSPTASVLYEFVHVTTLVIFFVIAGWSAVTSLRRRSFGRFALERVSRLLVPLAFGIVTFGSVIKYIELNNGRDLGLHGFRPARPLAMIVGRDGPPGFFDFFPRNLERLNLVTWSHLWFLAYLFLFSLALLPVLVWLARRQRSVVVPRGWVVYLPALPMAVVVVVFHGYWPFVPNLIRDWTNFSYFALCFLSGGVIAAWPGLEIRLRAEAPRMLALMLLAFLALELVGESAVGRLCAVLTAWGATGAGLGYAARFAPPATPLFRYLNEAALPIYIVHHVPLLLLGIVVLPLALPVGPKIVMIWLGATVLSLAAYHWLIRPWPPLRWLMGMAPRPLAGEPAPAAATARLT